MGRTWGGSRIPRIQCTHSTGPLTSAGNGPSQPRELCRGQTFRQYLDPLVKGWERTPRFQARMMSERGCQTVPVDRTSNAHRRWSGHRQMCGGADQHRLLPSLDRFKIPVFELPALPPSESCFTITSCRGVPCSRWPMRTWHFWSLISLSKRSLEPPCTVSCISTVVVSPTRAVESSSLAVLRTPMYKRLLSPGLHWVGEIGSRSFSSTASQRTAITS